MTEVPGERISQAIRVASGTHVGMRRSENQDSLSLFCTDQFQMYIVADGMGGAQGGAEASKLAIQTFSAEIDAIEKLSCEEIREAIKRANRSVHTCGSNDPNLSGMGTTFVGLALQEKDMFIFNVGDSRVYRYRLGRIESLTEDHTLVMDLVRAGALSPEQAEDHPVSHMLTRSLGPSDTVEPDCYVLKDGPVKGDRYLLCSDGLYNMVGDADLKRILEELDIEEAKDECIRLANERGGTDNISVILVEFGEDYPFRLEDFGLDEETERDRLGRHDDTLERTLEDIDEASEKDEQEEIVADPSEDQVAGETEASPFSEQRNTQKLGIDEHKASGAQATDSVEESGETERKRQPVSAVFLLTWLVAFSSAVAVFILLREPHYVDSDAGATIENYTESLLKSSEILGSEKAEEREKGYQKSSSHTVSASEENDSEERSLSPGFLVKRLSQEKDELEQRLDLVDSRLKELRDHLELVKSGDELAIQETASAVEEELLLLREKEERIAAELEVATRAMSIWYSRKRRLRDADPTRLAAEVAVSSKKVRDAKASFEDTNWQYLQASEELRYDPQSKRIQDKVKELALERKRRLGELSKAVREAVDFQAEVAQSNISKISLQRDELQQRIGEISQEGEQLESILASDKVATQDIEKEVVQQIALLEEEARELKAVLADFRKDFESSPLESRPAALLEEGSSADQS